MLKDGAPQTETGPWSLIRGTGKLKGLTGKGTYKGTAGADGGVWREIRPGVLKSGGHGRNVAKSSGRKWILRYEYLGVTRAGSCSRRVLWQVASAAVAHFYQEWLRKVQAVHTHSHKDNIPN